MDVKSSQNNSIQEIEEYISKERQEDPRFSPGKTSSGGFMYPPVHRKLIEKFVSEIKGMKRGNTNDFPNENAVDKVQSLLKTNNLPICLQFMERYGNRSLNGKERARMKVSNAEGT